MSNTPETTAEKIARIQAEKAALHVAREAKAAISPEQELAQLERELAEEKALDEAIATHGPLGKVLGTVATDMGLVIVKRPGMVAFRKFQDKTSERGAATTQETEALVRTCVVYPELGRFDVVLAELPGTLTRVADCACELAVGKARGTAGKS